MGDAVKITYTKLPSSAEGSTEKKTNVERRCHGLV